MIVGGVSLCTNSTNRLGHETSLPFVALCLFVPPRDHLQVQGAGRWAPARFMLTCLSLKPPKGGRT